MRDIVWRNYKSPLVESIIEYDRTPIVTEAESSYRSPSMRESIKSIMKEILIEAGVYVKDETHSYINSAALLKFLEE